MLSVERRLHAVDDRADFLERAADLAALARHRLEEDGRGEGLTSAAGETHRGTVKLGVCLDTCHVWDGGYDIVNDLDGVLDTFDRVIGLDRLKAIHTNDSMNVLGARKDRHEKIGKGKIGLAAFERLVNHPKLRDLPFYLETPCDLQGYKEEIALLKGLVK